MNVEGTLCVLQDIHISLVHNVMAKVTLRQTKSLSVPLIKIRRRVIAARAIQEERYKDFKDIHCNAQMTESMIHKYAEPDEAGFRLLSNAMERLSLSDRAYSRILKVARTIADLDASPCVSAQHIAEAIGYRNLDRGDWAER